MSNWFRRAREKRDEEALQSYPGQLAGADMPDVNVKPLSVDDSVQGVPGTQEWELEQRRWETDPSTRYSSVRPTEVSTQPQPQPQSVRHGAAPRVGLEDAIKIRELYCTRRDLKADEIAAMFGFADGRAVTSIVRATGSWEEMFQPLPLRFTGFYSPGAAPMTVEQFISAAEIVAEAQAQRAQRRTKSHSHHKKQPSSAPPETTTAPPDATPAAEPATPAVSAAKEPPPKDEQLLSLMAQLNAYVESIGPEAFGMMRIPENFGRTVARIGIIQRVLEREAQALANIYSILHDVAYDKDKEGSDAES